MADMHATVAERTVSEKDGCTAFTVFMWTSVDGFAREKEIRKKAKPFANFVVYKGGTKAPLIHRWAEL